MIRRGRAGTLVRAESFVVHVTLRTESRTVPMATKPLSLSLQNCLASQFVGEISLMSR
jgi:hypothetical protein